jgi:hypothetical protein
MKKNHVKNLREAYDLSENEIDALDLSGDSQEHTY